MYASRTQKITFLIFSLCSCDLFLTFLVYVQNKTVFIKHACILKWFSMVAAKKFLFLCLGKKIKLYFGIVIFWPSWKNCIMKNKKKLHLLETLTQTLEKNMKTKINH